MHNVEISCIPIARTRVDRDAIRQWLDRVGARAYEPPYDELTDAETLVGLAAKRCYASFGEDAKELNPNITRVRDSWVAYIDNILASRHGSVLQHATWTWAVEGVSRVFTAEANRHSAGVAVSEASLRYIRFSDIPWWMPFSLRESADDSVEATHKKARTREVFTRAFQQMQDNYDELVDLWQLDDPSCKFSEKKKITSVLRRIIGMGVATGAIYTLNMRALRFVMALRTDPGAEEEIAYVFSTIGKTMVEEETKLYGDFTQSEGGAWIPKYAKV